MKSSVSSLFLICAALLLCSCQAAPTESSITAPGKDSAALAYELSQKKWCSNDEACSLVLHLMDGRDESQNFAQRLDTLQQRRILSDTWDLQADQPVTKGTVAYMLCRALDLEGGLFMHVIPSRRYAYREAVYANLMQRGSDTEPLTGPEAVGIVGRAARMNDSDE